MDISRMDIKRVLNPRCIILVCVLIAGNAQASSVYMGSVAGYFSNADAGRGDYTNINNNDRGDSASDSSVFSWGLTSPRSRRGDQQHRSTDREHGKRSDEQYRSDRKHRERNNEKYRSERKDKKHRSERRVDEQHRPERMPSSSNFTFDGVGSDRGEAGFSASMDQVFSLGDFSYTNKATYFSRGVKGVDFTLELELDGYGFREFSYMLEILNTPNKSSNPADFVSLLNGVSSQSILHDNVLYELEILGFSRDGGITFENSTWVDEGSGTSGEIYAQFNTVSAVPVPAAVWLFGSGLLGLIGFARKHS